MLEVAYRAGDRRVWQRAHEHASINAKLCLRRDRVALPQPGNSDLVRLLSRAKSQMEVSMKNARLGIRLDAETKDLIQLAADGAERNPGSAGLR